jgi:uncharacterized protein (DUF934 family)
MLVIKDKQVTEDSWQVLAAGTDLPDHGDFLVGLELWNRGNFAARAGKVGLVLRSGDDVMKIERISQAPLVAVEFPKFTDGRGYSMARLLRGRLSYKGELRAIGNVLRDNLLFMQRCGFDAFVLQPGKNIEGSVTAFDELSERYQADANEPQPLFRRVAR